jgi:hypothetical protein
MTVCDHPGIASEKMANKENVALQAINLRIINDVTKKEKNAKRRRGQDTYTLAYATTLFLHGLHTSVKDLDTVPTKRLSCK